MVTSPPEEAEHIRGKTLTPESPKPVHYPSPSNIPILEKQMDPNFHEPPAPSQPYPQMPTPSIHSSASLYTDQQAMSSYQNMGGQGALGAAPAMYQQSAAYSTVYTTQSQDNPSSAQTYPSQNQAPASSYSEANSATYQDNRAAYPSYDSNAYAALQSQAHPPQGAQYQTQASPNGTVNYQALLDSLSPATEANNSDRYMASSVSSHPPSQGQAAGSSLPAAPNLPPRPPPQDKNATSSNAKDDIRSYHPHSQKSTNSQFRGNGQLQPLNVRASSGPQDSGPRSNHSPSTPGYSQRQSDDFPGDTPDDEDSRWPAEVNRLYEEFLEDERKYVTDGQWDQFPSGSRLFIGNLPTEKVTKRDIFHRFFKHGKLAQISIKQAYGFVQFLDTESSHRALQAEQGQAVRGRKMHLEISKPQRNTRKSDNDKSGGSRRRSRSPDYTRGGTNSQPRNGDRYNGNGKAMSPRDNRRYRDEYRGNRSPTPPRGGRGNRGRDRSRDRYDGRRRSRSRTPRRYRSPSPRRDTDDDLPLPFRAPHLIPDVQVLVVNEGLARDYIAWVEDSFRKLGLKIDVLILSPRLSEAAVVRRQIIEGVLAIVKLNTGTMSKAKVNLQIFDRGGGASKVTFNEYHDLDPSTAAALVVNVKQTQAQVAVPPTTQSYSSGYGLPPAAPAPYPSVAPPAAQFANPANNNPNLANIMSALGPNGLTQLLGAMTQSHPSQHPAAGVAPDLSQLLQSIAPSQQQASSAQVAQPQGQGQAFPNILQNPALASLLGVQATGQPPSAPTQAPASQPAGQPDMNEIMAQLAKYQR